MVRRPSRGVGSGQEALIEDWEDLPEGREWSGGHHKGSKGLPGGLGVVRRPSRRFRRTTQMAGSSREALAEGREDLTEGREWLGDHLRG